MWLLNIATMVLYLDVSKKIGRITIKLILSKSEAGCLVIFKLISIRSHQCYLDENPRLSSFTSQGHIIKKVG